MAKEPVGVTGWHKKLGFQVPLVLEMGRIDHIGGEVLQLEVVVHGARLCVAQQTGHGFEAVGTVVDPRGVKYPVRLRVLDIGLSVKQ